MVDFLDHYFQTVFPKQFFLFSTLKLKMSRSMHKMCQKVRNGQNLHNESSNFTNYFSEVTLCTIKLCNAKTGFGPTFHGPMNLDLRIPKI